MSNALQRFVPSNQRYLLCLTISVCVVLLGCEQSRPTSPFQDEAHSPAPEPAPRDSAVMLLIEALDDHGHTIEMTGDEVTVPTSFAPLVRLGSSALPTILAVTTDTDDTWIRDQLLDVIGRIGDPEGAPTLVSFLASPRPNTRSEALEALSRLAMPQTQPLLRSMLAQDPKDSGFERMRLLEALYRVGDHSVVSEVLETAMNNESQRFSAVQILTRHEPLRRALQLEGPHEEGDFELFSDELFFRAAQEWYLETHKGQPSPWKPTADFAYSEPFADEKRAAFALLEEQVQSSNDEFHSIRLLPVDPSETVSGTPKPMTLIYGWGHGGGLAVLAWRPDGDAMRLHRFVSSWRSDQDDLCTCENAIVPSSQYQQLCAGLQAIHHAKIVEWWSGTSMGFSTSSSNFAVLMRGPDAGVSRDYSGYPGSSKRINYAALCAARDRHRSFVEQHVNFQDAVADKAAKDLFAEVFLATHERWGLDQNWWWIRERMLALAKPFGSKVLIGPLAKYLEPSFAEGAHSKSRTATAACRALAAITGVDFHVDEDGEARPVAEVAKAYREHLRAK